jgi:hypothetical protein
MDDLRRPCAHRGTESVLKSALPTAEGDVEFCICRDCRRFWLERNGWLMSQRETMAILRTWPEPIGSVAH